MASWLNDPRFGKWSAFHTFVWLRYVKLRLEQYYRVIKIVCSNPRAIARERVHAYDLSKF